MAVEYETTPLVQEHVFEEVIPVAGETLGRLVRYGVDLQGVVQTLLHISVIHTHSIIVNKLKM